ncbi:hypothetical protein NQ317_014280 [Molorchus minor]|uniref:Uncharacterized protein n=1 Tax=Molorchus minor TaxID=1323400 RepID=A0ABQ9IU97_9CUCU|nr:hypothetical protein NQ317_014280 [Molorchus minor]
MTICRQENSHCLKNMLKPVRSLENFQNASPLSSPDRWVFPSRASAPMASPSQPILLPKPEPFPRNAKSPPVSRRSIPNPSSRYPPRLRLRIMGGTSLALRLLWLVVGTAKMEIPYFMSLISVPLT